MPVQVKVSGAWKKQKHSYVKVSGAWKTTLNTWVRVSGVWKKGDVASSPAMEQAFAMGRNA